MKRVIAVAAVAALGFGVATAYAGQNDGGMYIGVKAGGNDMSIPTDLWGSVTEIKTTEAQLNLHVGYLMPVADQFLLGGQIGYSYYGSQKVTASGDLKNTFTSLNFLAVGQYNIEKWFVQGRVGAGYFIINKKDNSSTYDSPYGNKVKAIAGASVGYYFTDNFSGEIFYDHVFGSSVKTGDYAANNNKKLVPTMNSVGIGLSYNF